MFKTIIYKQETSVTILILIDGFLQCYSYTHNKELKTVTILILIDGFLQYVDSRGYNAPSDSHNPYFNRWFSAIRRQ